MDKRECLICGYTYDSAYGNAERNIPPNTPFEQLPDNWTCPVWGAAKNKFVKKQPK